MGWLNVLKCSALSPRLFSKAEEITSRVSEAVSHVIPVNNLITLPLKS